MLCCFKNVKLSLKWLEIALLKWFLKSTETAWASIFDHLYFLRNWYGQISGTSVKRTKVHFQCASLNQNFELMCVKEFNARPKKHFHCKTNKANLGETQIKAHFSCREKPAWSFYLTFYLNFSTMSTRSSVWIRACKVKSGSKFI